MEPQAPDLILRTSRSKAPGRTGTGSGCQFVENAEFAENVETKTLMYLLTSNEFLIEVNKVILFPLHYIILQDCSELLNLSGAGVLIL